MVLYQHIQRFSRGGVIVSKFHRVYDRGLQKIESEIKFTIVVLKCIRLTLA